MRIRQLHINRFGHFNERTIAFPGNGLQVIYGPNEAGKTTLLEFLRGLLFDFPVRTPYDFGGQGDLAGAATLEMRDGRCVEMRRRKGNKDKVAIRINGLSTDVDDAAWLRMLDHADRGLFESVFAFGLDQLSQGEASLKHESLQSALFGGSLGGISSPDRILLELSRQADSLFKKGGSKPSINLLLAELKNLSKQIREHSLRPEKYHEAKAAASNAAEQALSLQQKVDQLRLDHSRVEKRVRAFPKWWELMQLCESRSAITVPSDISTEARQQFQAVSNELPSLAQGILEATEEISRTEQKLAVLQLAPASISFAAEIKACLELRQSYVEAREHLPERIRHRDALNGLIDRELNELRPGWTHQDLQAFSIDVAQRAQIERLSEGVRERAKLLTRLHAKQDADAAQLARAREELIELGMPRDVSAIAAVQRNEANYISDLKHRESNRGSFVKLERRLTTQCRRLTPPLAKTVLTPQEIFVPRLETVAEFESRFADVGEQLRAARSSVTEVESERQRIEQLLAEDLPGRVVPTLEDRQTARDRRDFGWQLVRQKYISQMIKKDPSGTIDRSNQLRTSSQTDLEIKEWLHDRAATSLPEEYERAVRAADEVSDEIYANADAVAKRENIRRQLADLALRLDEKQQRVIKLERQLTELHASWLALWAPCGFEPLAADAMRGWLKDHETVCATCTQRDELNDELLQLDQRILSFESRLRTACTASEDTDDISQLLASAGQSIQEAKDQDGRRSTLRKDIRRLEQQLASYHEEVQSLEAREVVAKSAWLEVMNHLDLPSQWSPELTREVIDKLQATRIRLDSLPEEESRIAAMQLRTQDFERRVHGLCAEMMPEFERDPSELAVVKLDEQLQDALEARRNHDVLSRRLEDSHHKLDSLTELQIRREAEKAQLFALAEVTTEAAFLEAVTRVEKASKLDVEIEQLRRELDLIRAGDDREEFERSLAATELAILQGQERDLREELRSTELLRSEAEGRKALASAALEQLDGSDIAAELSEQQARKRSQLAAEVDRYLPVVYARFLLNTAVDRFEKENQPEMITTVSRLLNEMTAGKYIEFDRMGGGKQNIMIRRYDGVERTPEQLSTGTREQLYLAIRIAYVLHYCGKNEPLPIVIDDVLVNFDGQRARQTLKTLAGLSESAQVLFFTCHTHIVEMACEIVPAMSSIDLTVPMITRAH